MDDVGGGGSPLRIRSAAKSREGIAVANWLGCKRERASDQGILRIQVEKQGRRQRVRR